MYGLAVYVKEGFSFAKDLSIENSADFYLCFQLALLHSVPFFFSLYQSPALLLFTVFDSVSSNTDEVLSINPSKDWPTYSGGTDRPGKLCYSDS